MKWHVSFSLISVGIGVGWLAGLSISPVISIVITTLTGATAAIIAAMNGLEKSNDHVKEVGSYQVVLDKRKVDPLPLALLVSGIVIGVSLGISARNHSWLGSDVSGEIDKWMDMGLTREEVTRRLFEVRYPNTSHEDFFLLTNIGQASDITATLALSATVTMWTNLGLKQEDVARRLFEINYPLHETANTSTALAGLGVTNTVLYSRAVQECDSLSNFLLPFKSESLAANEAVRLRNEVATTNFSGLLPIVDDMETLRKVLEELCKRG